MNASVDVNWFTLILTIALPVLTALVTNKLAHPGLKAVTLLALSLIGGFVNEWYQAVQAGVGYDIQSGLLTAGFVFLAGTAAHFGLLKPAGVTGAYGAVATAVPGGVGQMVERF